jgi:hypothetical protein
MFDPEFQAPIGDDLLYPLQYLARVAGERGISVSTIDTEPLDSYDAILFLDFPGNQNRYLKKLISMKFENLYLFVCENEIIKPDNWRQENYQHFKRSSRGMMILLIIKKFSNSSYQTKYLILSFLIPLNRRNSVA